MLDTESLPDTLNRNIGTTEQRRNGTGIIQYDLLDSRVKPGPEQEQPTTQYNDVNHRHHRPAHAVEESSPVELPVGDSEEDEAEKGVEGSAEEGQKIAHTRNDLGEYERDDPDASHD